MSTGSGPTNHDVIVVGLGAMGAAATCQLAGRGVRVLGLDRLSPPHTLGSTHGDTRITRQAIGEGVAYVPLAIRSHQLWREIEAATGADLLTTNGALVLARPGSPTAFHHRTNFLEQTIAAARAFHIPHEVLDAAAVAERFPQFRLAGDEVGYLEPGGGFLRPEACVDAQLHLAVQRGAEIHLDEPMEALRIDRSGATVTTTRGSYSAAKVLLSIGPWLPALLDDSVRRNFQVQRQVMHWFATTPDAEQMGADRCPVYIWETTAGEPFYGFPAVDGPAGGVKVATEQFELSTDPDTVERRVHADESLALYDGIVAGRLPLLERDPLRAVVCLYTTTPDGNFVVDWHPDSDDVLLVSPCSGHGFKHSAAIGEACAQLVTDGVSSVDLSAFSLGRFAR